MDPQRGQCLRPSFFGRVALSIRFLFCLLLAIEAQLHERNKTALNLMEYVIWDNWEKAVSEQNKNILAVGARKWQSLPPCRQALSRDHFTVIAVLRKERRLPFLTYFFPCSLPEHGLRKQLVCFSTSTTCRLSAFGQQSCSTQSKQAEPWEKLCPLPQRTSIPSDGLSSSPRTWLSCLPISMCGFSLPTTSTGSGRWREWSSQGLEQQQYSPDALQVFFSFSSLSPWRHQVSVMGQRLVFLQRINQKQRWTEMFSIFCSLPWGNGLSFLDIRGWTAFAWENNFLLLHFLSALLLLLFTELPDHPVLSFPAASVPLFGQIIPFIKLVFSTLGIRYQNPSRSGVFC